MESDRHYALGKAGAVGARAGQPRIHMEEATVRGLDLCIPISLRRN